MTTQDIANRYYELASQAQWGKISEELHDDKVVCMEPEHMAAKGLPIKTEGKEALQAKAAANRQRIETLHTQYCSKPIVAGDFFSVELKRDVTFKNMSREQKEEIGVFRVKDGKIVSEQFFY